MDPAENSGRTAPGRRLHGKPFAKGVSGNPGGRPKGLSRLIREKTADGAAMINFMVDVLDGQIRASVKDRIEAARWLAERGFGRVERPAMSDDADLLVPRNVILIGGTEEEYINSRLTLSSSEEFATRYVLAVVHTHVSRQSSRPRC